MTDQPARGLGRLYAPDQRDARFMLGAHPAAAQIEAVESHIWTLHRDRHMDQGRTGTCVGHGWKYLLMTAPFQQGSPATAPTAFGIYDLAIVVDEWSENDGDIMRQMGTSVRAGGKVLQRLGYIKEYNWARDANEMARWIGGRTHSGRRPGGPVVIGVRWHQSMFETDAEGFLRIPAGSTSRDGHCVCILGWNQESGWFTGVQSWELPWGYHGTGYFKIDAETMDRLLREDGEACTPVEKWVRISA